MKISVLIVCYNEEEYIEECLDSILSQDYPDIEIIIIDDSSTDRSLDIIRAYGAEHPTIKYFVNSSNSGVGFSKRRAIMEAQGDVCGFVDADDTLEPGCLRKVMDGFNSLEEKTDVVYTQYFLCNKKLEEKKIHNTNSKVPYQETLFFNINFEVSHFFCFRKKTYLETSGMNTSLLSAVDQDLYLKLYEKGRFKFIKEPLYNYRVHAGGISQDKNKKKELYKNWHLVLEETLERRNIKTIYGVDVKNIPNLPNFIWQKQNTFLKRLMRKISNIF